MSEAFKKAMLLQKCKINSYLQLCSKCELGSRLLTKENIRRINSLNKQLSQPKSKKTCVKMSAFPTSEKLFSNTKKRSLKTITLANLILSKKQGFILIVKAYISTSFCTLKSRIVYLYSGKHSTKAEVGGKCLVVTTELFLKL